MSVVFCMGMGINILSHQKPVPVTIGCGFCLFPVYALNGKVAQPPSCWVSLQSTTSLNHTPPSVPTTPEWDASVSPVWSPTGPAVSIKTHLLYHSTTTPL